MTSGSGGVQVTTSVSARTATSELGVRAATPAASTSAAVAWVDSGSALLRADLSRCTVSPESAPAPRTSLRRARVKNDTAPRTTTTPIAMEMTAAVLMTGGSPFALSQFEEQTFDPGQDEVETRASEERADQHKHRPEHEEHRHQARHELAVLGLVGGVAVEERGQDECDQADAGKRHAGHHRVEVHQQLLEAEEVPGGLGGVGGLVGVGQLQQRSVHEDREDERERRHRQCGDELGGEQVRPGVDFV